MDEKLPFSYSPDLSPEDLQVLKDFYALEDSPPPTVTGALPSDTAQPTGEAQLFDFDADTDMLILFASEADEDINTLRRALHQVGQDENPDSPGLAIIARTTHKLKGTAGAVGCEAMSKIAATMENEVKRVKNRRIPVMSGLMSLSHALNALERTLQSMVEDGHENPEPLQTLLQDITAFNLETGEPGSTLEEPGDAADYLEDIDELPDMATVSSSPNFSLHDGPATVRVDPQHLHSLLLHTEQLIEQHTPLESSQKQVESALAELQAAQVRLRRLETLLSTLSFVIPSHKESEKNNPSLPEERPFASLVASILYEAPQRTGRSHQFKSSLYNQPLRSPDQTLWDEMEMDRFTETHVLTHSLSEAIADVTTASSQLRQAFTQLNTLIEQQTAQADLVRRDTLRLRSAPFSTLLAWVQQTVQHIARAQKQDVQFESSGENIEIDQHILAALSEPFMQLVRSGLADGLLWVASGGQTPQSAADNSHRHRIWLHATAIGPDVSIELGFSLPVPGGALDAMSASVQRLRGSMSVLRNDAGGITYRLRFPRSQGTIQGLLVRSGGQGFIVPFSQVEAIDYKQQQAYDQFYILYTLLGLPLTAPAQTPAPLQQVLLLANTQWRVGIQVDEIIGDVELVIKPLAPHLQRPGISGTAADGMGNILLILDLPELIRKQDALQQLIAATSSRPSQSQVQETPTSYHANTGRPVVLVVDDSMSMRQSLHQTLEHAGYDVLEAHDGIEALEQLAEHTPTLMLLDIEMPNLNGYDLLNILRTRPFAPPYKILLLTSRSSEKHRRRARELGAYDFLTKPCPQDVLLRAIDEALADVYI